MKAMGASVKHLEKILSSVEDENRLVQKVIDKLKQKTTSRKE